MKFSIQVIITLAGSLLVGVVATVLFSRDSTNSPPAKLVDVVGNNTPKPQREESQIPQVYPIFPNEKQNAGLIPPATLLPPPTPPIPPIPSPPLIMMHPQRRAPIIGSEWQVFEESCIDGTISSITSGTIFKTSTGGIYEVTAYVYEYVYAYRPNVLVLRNGGSFKLIVDGVSSPLICQRLNGTTGDSLLSSAVIESRITSQFKGFRHGNIYKLANGQIWEQTEFYSWSWSWAMPNTMIYQANGTYKMRVEQIDHAITVRRIK